MICTIFGIVMIYSMTSSYGWAKYVVVQGFAMFLGIGAFVVFTVIDPDLIADKWVYLTIFNVLFIVGLIFFGKGDEVGAHGIVLPVSAFSRLRSLRSYSSSLSQNRWRHIKSSARSTNSRRF